MHRKLILFLATGGGVGWIPGPQGTYGSVIGLLLYTLLFSLKPLPILVFVLFFSLFSIWIADQAEHYIGEKDSGKIVIDEIAGLFVTLLFLPHTWGWMLAGFLTFRFFDIAKPFPIRQVEQRLKGGWGVVCDDLAAGVFANLVLQIARWVLFIT